MVENENIMVSVCMITYNHEDYISQAIEGVLMQKTKFPIELIIGEDCSTDKTREICVEYQQKYPEIIKLQLPEKNKGMMRNFIENMQAAQGKYIALCEGDDYWTDPYKLQRQVDFLEKNEDFSICFHAVGVKKEQENVVVNDYITRDVPDVTDIYDLAQGNYIHTPSVVFRKNEEVLELTSSPNIFVIDYVLHMFNARFGKIKKLPDIMATYRIHSSNMWVDSDNVSMSKNIVKYLKGLLNKFSSEVNQILNKRYIDTNLYLAKHYQNTDDPNQALFYFLEALSVPNDIISNYFENQRSYDKVESLQKKLNRINSHIVIKILRKIKRLFK